jgi:hypothetical protein
MNDLWADLETPAQEPGRHKRKLNEQMVISTLRHWLLQDYAAAYCRSLAATRIYRRCYWIDALAPERFSQPPAEQENGNEPANKRRKKSSNGVLPAPLQSVVSLSQQLASETRPIALHGLLLASGSSRRREGKGALHELILPRESGVLQASWLEASSFLLKELEQAPAIFLLAPFAATPFSSEDLNPLYQRSVPSELCLLISHKQIAQLLQTAQSTRQDERRQQVATLLTGLLRSDRWKTLPTTEAELEQSVTGWLDLFCTATQRHFPLPVQRINLPFHSGRAHTINAPYSLLFATRRQDSLSCMNDAVYRYHLRIQTESRTGVLSEVWFAEQEQVRQQERLELARERILQLGRAQRIRRWPDLRQQLLQTYFGQILLSDYDLLIQQLLHEGRLRCTWRQAASEEPRIPGNDDTLLW